MTNEKIVLKYQESKDQDLLAELYQKNRGLIWKVVNRFKRSSEVDDLLQESYFAVLQAAERWRPDRGASFSSYLYKWCKAVVLRYNRSCVCLPEYKETEIRNYHSFIAEFIRDRGREPSDTELMKALNISQEKLDKLRADASADNIRYLSEPIGEGMTLGDLVPDSKDCYEAAENKIQHEQLKEALSKTINLLEPIEKEIVNLRYRKDRTLQETAEETGLTIQRIRLIEAKAFRKLRSPRLARELIPFLEDCAVRYGYGASGLGQFRRIGSSSVELAALAIERRELGI